MTYDEEEILVDLGDSGRTFARGSRKNELAKGLEELGLAERAGESIEGTLEGANDGAGARPCRQGEG